MYLNGHLQIRIQVLNSISRHGKHFFLLIHLVNFVFGTIVKVRCCIRLTWSRKTVSLDPTWHLYNPSSLSVSSRMIKSPVCLLIHILSFMVPGFMYSIVGKRPCSLLYRSQNVADMGIATFLFEKATGQWSMVCPPSSPVDYFKYINGNNENNKTTVACQYSWQRTCRLCKIPCSIWKRYDASEFDGFKLKISIPQIDVYDWCISSNWFITLGKKQHVCCLVLHIKGQAKSIWWSCMKMCTKLTRRKQRCCRTQVLRCCWRPWNCWWLDLLTMISCIL